MACTQEQRVLCDHPYCDKACRFAEDWREKAVTPVPAPSKTEPHPKGHS